MTIIYILTATVILLASVTLCQCIQVNSIRKRVGILEEKVTDIYRHAEWAENP